ncbi:MAG: septal ring lytic transglycosylase RlpA family protein [Pseudomonadota bacterium]
MNAETIRSLPDTARSSGEGHISDARRWPLAAWKLRRRAGFAKGALCGVGLYGVVLGGGVLALACTSLPAAAKTPGVIYCYNTVCHRVLTLRETYREIGVVRDLVASHYSGPKHDRFNPSLMTSSGERFKPHRPDNAASPIYPDGTVLLVWHPNTKRTVIVRINNAGPYWGNRTLDLSRAAAAKLGFAKRGIARVQVVVLKAPRPREARYRRGRRYARVAGYIGRHTSVRNALNKRKFERASATLRRARGLITPGGLSASSVPRTGRAPRIRGSLVKVVAIGKPGSRKIARAVARTKAIRVALPADTNRAHGTTVAGGSGAGAASFARARRQAAQARQRRRIARAGSNAYCRQGSFCAFSQD